MNKLIISAMLLSLPMYAQADSLAAAKDRFCITLGDVAGSIVDARGTGRTLESVIAQIPPAEPLATKLKAIAQYTYMMDYDKVTAMKIVYLRCGSGLYD